jgi:Ras-related protein Rab-1A
MLRFVDDRYPTCFISTLGVDFQSKTVQVDSSLIKLQVRNIFKLSLLFMLTVSKQIWDTAGQERFCSLTRTYFNGAQGVILVYDITDRESFFRVRNWMDEIDRVSIHEPPYKNSLTHCFHEYRMSVI